MSRGRTAGNKGQGSKWISKKTRHRIYARDGWRCVWCGEPVVQSAGTKIIALTEAVAPHIATLDHVIPRSAGGANIPANLITSCMGCNRDRGDRDPMLYLARFNGGSDWHNASLGLTRILDAVCKPLPPAP